MEILELRAVRGLNGSLGRRQKVRRAAAAAAFTGS
jgi:hypothetical protein